MDRRRAGSCGGRHNRHDHPQPPTLGNLLWAGTFPPRHGGRRGGDGCGQTRPPRRKRARRHEGHERAARKRFESRLLLVILTLANPVRDFLL